MPIEFKPGLRYRMPVAFGPMPGPRQRVDGTRYDNTFVRIEAATASFLTAASHLERLLPPGFSLEGEPVVTVEFNYITEIQWLAGRGYNTLGVRFPVRYRGARDNAAGPFLALLWENKADPIITGREELGFAKLFCDIPPPRILDGRRHYSAAWEGHSFMEMEVSDLVTREPAPASPIDGILHYKYMPRTGQPGVADVSGAALTPPAAGTQILSHAVGQGTVRFQHSTWEQLPTLVHIVNALAELPKLENRGATLTTRRANTELQDQRMLG